MNKKTKEEQIEEMVGVMAASNNPFVDVPIEIMPQVAEALYNAGYRKIDDKCAVITKDDLNLYKKQSVKEFATLVKRECTFTNNHGLDLIRVVDFDVLLREYEVEE